MSRRDAVLGLLSFSADSIDLSDIAVLTRHAGDHNDTISGWNGPMLLWIESQPTPIIALILFGFSYAIAAIILAGAVAISRRRLADELKATSPVMLTPLSVVAGLMIAFLASRVWANLDHAGAYLSQEASALQQTALFVDTLPPEVGSGVHADIRAYIAFTETQDWPAMAAGRASLSGNPPGLPDAIRTLVTFAPANSGQQVAQERAIIAIESALSARRGRVLLSEATIEPIQWTVIVLLLVLVLVTIAKVHIDRHTTAAAALFIFATAMAACLILLMVNDRPLSSGGLTLQPTALHEIGAGP